MALEWAGARWSLWSRPAAVAGGGGTALRGGEGRLIGIPEDQCQIGLVGVFWPERAVSVKIASLQSLRAESNPSPGAALVQWWGLILPAAPSEAGLLFSPSANSLGTLISLFFCLAEVNKAV